MAGEKHEIYASDSEGNRIDEPVKVGGRLVYPDGREVDAETGETIINAAGEYVGPAVRTERIVNIADTIVSSTSELEAAFSNLSDGETVWIGQPDTSYRTSQWLDVEASNVHIIGQSPFAADGQALIKPQDGADVGGIRAGTGATARSNIRIECIGFDGNESTMTNTVKRLHGVILDNVQNAAVNGCYFTKTHPYHEHGSGGSGVTVRNTASEVSVQNNFIEDIGDRGIQVSGENCIIAANKSINGFDRTVSLDVTQPDGNFYLGRNCAVTGNVGRDNSQGSIIGIGGKPPTTQSRGVGFISIIGNAGYGSHRRIVRISEIQSGTGRLAVVGNVGDGTNSTKHGIFIDTHPYVIVSSNVLSHYDLDGIRATGGGAILSNNIIRSPGRHGIRSSSDWSNIYGNLIYSAGDHGIDIQDTANPSAVVANVVRESNQDVNGSNEIHCAATGTLIAGNLVPVRNGASSINEVTGANNNHIVGNKVPDDGNAYSIVGAGTRLKANSPTHYDLDEVLASVAGGGTALSSAISRAALGDDIAVEATVNADPAADAAFIAYPYWDDTAGALKVQAENKTANAADVRVTAKLQ